MNNLKFFFNAFAAIIVSYIIVYYNYKMSGLFSVVVLLVVSSIITLIYILIDKIVECIRS